MIASLFIWKNLNLRPKLARFPCKARADTINRSFVVRGRLCLHKKFEERFCIHTDSPEEQAERQADQAGDRAVGGKSVQRMLAQIANEPFDRQPSNNRCGDKSYRK